MTLGTISRRDARPWRCHAAAFAVIAATFGGCAPPDAAPALDLEGTQAAAVLSTGPDWSSVETAYSQAIAWGDLDGDGDLDLAIGNGGWDQLYRNDAGTLVYVGQLGSSGLTESLAWGDWDNDGDLDLAVGRRQATNVVLENLGSALAYLPVWSSAEVDTTYAVDWADWDGDGDLDLVVGNGDGEPNRIYENQSADAGVGLDTTPVWSSAETDDTYDLEWGDYDSDGDPDLAVANYAGVNRVYRNNGGSLALIASPASPWYSVDVTWGDVDGDTDLDLAFAQSGTNEVWKTNGSTFSLSWSSPGTESSTASDFADWDGDGDLDLAVANQSAVHANQVFANDGAGTFSLAWSSTETNASLDISWVDIDRDGDEDLFAANYESTAGTGQNHLYLNDDSQFGFGWQSGPGTSTWDLAWGDWDGDGDLDLAVANEVGEIQILENDGGSLSLAEEFPTVDGARGVAWGDWDGDGDLDLALGRDGGNLVLENTGGFLDPVPVWTSPNSDETRRVA